MIQEQAILNVLHECGIRVGNYDENCGALLNEAKKAWQTGETHKPLMPFVHTNVLLSNDQNRGIYTASATIFFPFMLKIPAGTTRTTTTEEGRVSLLDVANDNADFIEESVFERFCPFLAMVKKASAPNHCFFNNVQTIRLLRKLQEYVFKTGIPFHFVHGTRLYQFSVFNNRHFVAKLFRDVKDMRGEENCATLLTVLPHNFL